MKILVVGANGLIGSTMFRVLCGDTRLEVFGSVRDEKLKLAFNGDLRGRLIAGIDVLDESRLVRLLNSLRPDVIINCAGLTKHLPGSSDPLIAIPINAIMPHRIAALSELLGARFIHVSTDCVFCGDRGAYTEDNCSDARDVYGRSKALGEVIEANSVTLRTSTIGHELNTSYGLLNWFLNQHDSCKGFKKAFFSGLPTVVFAKVVRDFVLPQRNLSGLFHVSADPINKFDLLKLVAKVYGKEIDIIPDESVVIDRSLDGRRFSVASGFVAPSWPDLIKTMYIER